MIEKIMSGGQTGADQAALDAAIKLGIPVGTRFIGIKKGTQKYF